MKIFNPQQVIRMKHSRQTVKANKSLRANQKSMLNYHQRKANLVFDFQEKIQRKQ